MNTKELEEKLNKSGDFDAGLISDNAPPEFHVLINKYMDEKKITKAEIIRKLNIDRNYGYLILNGARIPTRNCLIQLSLILGLDTEQMNYLLRLVGKPPLYVRNIVDARIFYAVKHQMEYFEAVDFIWGDTVG